ncbi:MAG: hypothetical protein WC949_00835 [Candidatus Paceibacterota bacterium]
MDIAVFLVLGFPFGSYCHPATAATDQAAKRPRIVFRLAVDVRSLLQNFLHFVKKFLWYDPLVPAFVQFAGIAE